MLLQIQPDESLPSYVSRNLLLNRYASGAGVFKDLVQRYSFRNAQVRKISSAMGLPGCYGFNSLIHNHTLMAVNFVIKNPQDVSYSDVQYTTRWSARFSDWNASFCPDCVKEDLENLGFSYWRRFCVPDVKVCYKHNTVLLNRCPYCNKLFSRPGHTLDVLWRKCDGRHLVDAPSIPNDDPFALKRAIAFHGICSSLHHIPDEVVLRTLRDKAASLIPILSGDFAAKMESEFHWLDVQLEIVDMRRLNKIVIPNPSYHLRIIDAIATVYERFGDFLMDLRSQEFDVRPIDSLWATYQMGGLESPHFVEEDYIGGTGRWFCPYPRPLSETERSYDVLAKPPRQYPCCNLSHPKVKGVHATIVHASEVAPRVPRISRGIAAVKDS